MDAASTSSLLRVPRGSSAAFPPRAAPGARRAARRVSVGGGFADEGHLRYYASAGRAKEAKARRKLEGNLSRDLSALIGMGGFDLEERTAVDRDGGGPQRMSIAEAAELLLAQLEQARAKEKEAKMRKKKEGKSMGKKKDCEDSSSSLSESSESSDSDCEEEVVDMSTLRVTTPTTPLVVAPVDPPMIALCVPKDTELQTPEESLSISTTVPASPNCATGCTCTGTMDRTVGSDASLADARSLPMPPSSLPAAAVTGNKIEVCMGGKCKRSGGLQLMEEFSRHVGAEGAVVGCKCLGKCKEGPNVRIVSQCLDVEASDTRQRNPLCIGVGLEDVGAIVSSYFGEPRSLGVQPC